MGGTRRWWEDGLYYGLGGLFYAAPRLLYTLHVNGVRRFRHRPSTLIVVNHKRDLDSVILPATLFFNGIRPKRPLWFAGREDMAVRGFLATYEVVPLWLRRLLHEIDLTAVLRALRVLPVRRFPERTMAEALREIVALFGDRPAAEVLSPEEAALLVARYGAQARIAAATTWPFRHYWRRPARLRAFAPSWSTAVRLRQRDAVAAQLARLAEVLNRGENLYMAPEGVISPHGCFQAFRLGFRRVLEQAEIPVRLLPAAIVYDFMRPGALRVFISVGEEMRASGNPADAVAEVRRALAALQVMTCSQLAGQVAWDLVHAGRTTVQIQHFEGAVLSLAASLAEEGLRVDASLRAPGGARRVMDWLAYARRRGILTRRGAAVEFPPGRFQDRPATHWANPVRYAANELQSVREALAGRAPPLSLEEAVGS